MLIALWIVNVITALVFLAAGGMKTARPKQALAELGMGWVENFSPASIRLIGAAEIVGALGLILPLATGIASFLAPIAALCLAVLMVGATVVHLRRKETLIPTIVLALLAIASAVLGFIVL